LMPLIGLYMVQVQSRAANWWTRLTGQAWVPTAIVLLVIYAAGFGYLVAGMPGVPPASGLPAPIAWQEFGERVSEIESELHEAGGQPPIVIGLDKYWIASQTLFYADRPPHRVELIGGEKLVGSSSLMWDSWFPADSAQGKNCLIIGFSLEQLNRERVTKRFPRLGQVTKEVLTNFSGEIGYFYWRMGFDYRPRATGSGSFESGQSRSAESK
jgi:dolichol-phosphate mannosyltransferase